MFALDLPQEDPTPLPLCRQIDALCDEFEAKWRADERPHIETYLALLSEEGRRALLLELLPLELLYRRSRGDTVSEEEYHLRLPEHAATVASVFRSVNASIEARVSADTSQSSAAGLTTDAGALHPRISQTEDIPTVIGKYRVVSLLGAGGQAEAYRAVHPELNRDVVIKLARPWPGAAALPTEHLVVEGRALAKLEHPHLARVYDVDVCQGRPFLVMEYVAGIDLQQYASQKNLSLREKVDLVACIADAVAEAHAHGIVHLDIKPENIVVSQTGHPYLIDFGLAKLHDAWNPTSGTDEGLCGTVAYMAPEQARGDTSQIDHRSDVFGLGAVLYYLLVGEAPFAGAAVSECLQRAQACQFDHSLLNRIPRSLASICLNAMCEIPAERSSSAADLSQKLRKWSISASHRLSKRAVGLLSVGGLLLAIVLLGLLYGLTNDVPDAKGRQIARPGSDVHGPYATAKMRWDRALGELWLDDKMVRRVRNPRTATNIVGVLDAFEQQEWSRKISSPFSGDDGPQRLYAAVRSLNEGLIGVRFRADDGGNAIIWELVRPED